MQQTLTAIQETRIKRIKIYNPEGRLEESRQLACLDGDLSRRLSAEARRRAHAWNNYVGGVYVVMQFDGQQLYSLEVINPNEK